MKLILAILLMAPVIAPAATEIIYNRSANPDIPAQGFVTRDQVCVDEDNNVLQVFNPEEKAVVTKPRMTTEEVCVDWNRNDSAHPVCVTSMLKQVPLSESYEQYTFDRSDYRKERPVSMQVKRLEKCRK